MSCVVLSAGSSELKPSSGRMEAGKAGEHLVCTDLLRRGYRAMLSDQGLPYDVLVDLGEHVVRVQVRTIISPRPLRGTSAQKGYRFDLRKRRGHHSQRRVAVEDCDVIACVALDILRVSYLPISRLGGSTIIFGPTRPIGTESFEEAIRAAH